MPNFSVFRVDPLHTLNQISALSRHNLREYQPSNADPNRQHLNLILIGPESDFALQAKAMLGDQKMRNGRQRKTRIAAKVILSATRQAFEVSDESRNLDARKIKAWKDESISWLKDKYGTKILSAVLDLDELTPHIHAIIIPLKDDGKLSYKTYFGERQTLRDLHTEYANILAPLGIRRGIERSPVRHEDIKKYYNMSKAVDAALPDLPPLQEAEPIKQDGRIGLIKQTPSVYLTNAEALRDEARQAGRDEAEFVLEKARAHAAQVQEEVARRWRYLQDEIQALKEAKEALIAQYSEAKSTIANLTQTMNEYKDQAMVEKAAREEAEAAHTQLKSDYDQTLAAIADPNYPKDQLVSWAESVRAAPPQALMEAANLQEPPKIHELIPKMSNAPARDNSISISPPRI